MTACVLQGMVSKKFGPSRANLFVRRNSTSQWRPSGIGLDVQAWTSTPRPPLDLAWYLTRPGPPSLMEIMLLPVRTLDRSSTTPTASSSVPRSSVQHPPLRIANQYSHESSLQARQPSWAQSVCCTTRWGMGKPAMGVGGGSDARIVRIAACAPCSGHVGCDGGRRARVQHTHSSSALALLVTTNAPMLHSKVAPAPENRRWVRDRCRGQGSPRLAACTLTLCVCVSPAISTRATPWQLLGGITLGDKVKIGGNRSFAVCPYLEYRVRAGGSIATGCESTMSSRDQCRLRVTHATTMLRSVVLQDVPANTVAVGPSANTDSPTTWRSPHLDTSTPRPL